MEEKTYIFHRHASINDKEVIEVKESELTQSQKDLLFADFLKEFENLPTALQDRFVNKMINKIISK